MAVMVEIHKSGDQLALLKKWGLDPENLKEPGLRRQLMSLFRIIFSLPYLSRASRSHSKVTFLGSAAG